MIARFHHFSPAYAGLACTGLFLTTVLSACVLDAAGTSDGKEMGAQPASDDDAGATADLDAAAASDAIAIPQGDTGKRIEPDDAGTPSDANDLDARPARSDASQDANDAASSSANARVDAQLASDASDADAKPPLLDAAVDASMLPSCTLAGRFALQFDYDVEWRGTSLAGVLPLLRAGRGQVRVWLGVDTRETGARTRSRVHGCGATLPDFAAMNSRIGTELYSSRFPEESWDQPSMPRWDLDWQASCLTPGCAISSSPLATTLGARVTANNPWPGPNGALDQLMVVDHDADGAPGLTIISRTPAESSASGVPYIQIPLSWTLTPRASRLFMALQVAFQFEGGINNCNELSGVLNEGRVENRVVGCSGRATPEADEVTCTPEQASFLDRNLPEWTVTGGRWRAQRIADDASCSDVREALH